MVLLLVLMQSNLGKVLRLHDDGSIPDDNPFVGFIGEDPLVDDIGVYGQIWSLGHRNPLGLAFDLDGGLFDVQEVGVTNGEDYRRSMRYRKPIATVPPLKRG